MIRTIAAAAAFTAISLSQAFAGGSLTSTVVSYDAEKKTIVTGAFENISIRFEGLEIPATLSAGDKITIEFDAGEDGFDKITSITILEDK